MSPLQGFSLSIDVSTMILLSALFYDFLRGLVSPLQGFSLSIDVSTMILRRKVCRICPMQGFWRTNLTIYLLDLLGDAVVSAFRHDTFS